MKEKEKRGKRKDQCINCRHAVPVENRKFGRFVKCKNHESAYYDKLVPFVKPSCHEVGWLPVAQCRMMTEEDLYADKRTIKAKDTNMKKVQPWNP